jgi:hypothetical protein
MPKKPFGTPATRGEREAVDGGVGAAEAGVVDPCERR